MVASSSSDLLLDYLPVYFLAKSLAHKRTVLADADADVRATEAWARADVELAKAETIKAEAMKVVIRAGRSQ